MASPERLNAPLELIGHGQWLALAAIVVGIVGRRQSGWWNNR